MLDPDFESVFVMTGEDYFFVSARLVREVATFGGDVSGLVPKNVAEGLRKKLGRPDLIRTVRGAGYKAVAP